MNVKRAILAAPRLAAMTALAPLERSLLAKAPELAHPPVFIVGPPRSGTTLLYEAMVTRFRFSYFSNIAHRLHRTPAAATKLGAGAIHRWKGDFQSRYGHIPGWGSPNEGGWIWKRWIPEEHALNETDVAGRPVDVMSRTVAAIAGLLEAPFLNKNVMHSVHMRLLDAIFPECLFVECRRDPMTTGRSILRARTDEFGEGGLEKWLSVQPPGWDLYAERSPGEQAVAQVMLTRAAIAQDAAGLGAARHLVVEYEQLCDQPESVVGTIQSFFRSHSVVLEDRDELPAEFARPASRPLSEMLEGQLHAACELWSGQQSGMRTARIAAAS